MSKTPDLSAVQRRFVASSRECASLHRDGFLKVGDLSASRALTSTDELVGREKSYVLLGAGGAGKSTTLRMLAVAEGCEVHDLWAITRDDLRDEIGSAARAGMPLFLDTIDRFEGSTTPNLRALRHDLRHALRAGVRLRLGCRTAQWNETFASELASVADSFVSLFLLPLDRVAAVEMTAEFGGARFIDALVQAGRGHLASSPQHLLAAAEHWHSTGRLAESTQAALAWEIGKFLTEFDQDRASAVGFDRKLRVAQRLAAFHVFSAVPSFTDYAREPACSVATLPTDPEPERPDAAVDPSEYAAVLNSPLFEGAAVGGVTFRHLQYAEYLAASYLVTRKVSFARLRQLLSVHRNGLIPGARIGVANWLLALNPELLEPLLVENATAFIQAGNEVPADEVRAELVDGLLFHVTDRGLHNSWGLDLSILAHAGLEDQLAARLEVPGVSDLELWWVTAIAVACRCRRLGSCLAEAAWNPAREPWVRKLLIRASTALDESGSADVLRGLYPLDAATDFGLEVTAALIDSLYPSKLQITEVLATVHLGTSDQTSRDIRVALERIVKTATRRELPSILEWVAEQPVNHQPGSDTDNLFTAAISAAWVVAEDEAVLNALANMLVRSDQSRRWILYQNHSEPLPWLEAPGTQRRALLHKILDLVDEATWPTVLALRLLRTADVPQLLGELSAMPEQRRQITLKLLDASLQAPDATIADLVLSLAPDHPAYTATGWCRATMPVAPPNEGWRLVAARRRADEREGLQRVRAYTVALQDALDRARTDLEGWWRVAELLSFNEDAITPPGGLSNDLLRRPGLARLSEEDQTWLIHRGIEYVEAHRPINHGRVNANPPDVETAMPDYCGVFLLVTLLEHFPALLDLISEPTWQRWISVIVSDWELYESDNGDARGRLIHAAPITVRTTAAEIALQQLDCLNTDSQVLQPYGVYSELLPDLAPVLGQRLAEHRYNGYLAAGLLGLLVLRAPSTAVEACHKLVRCAGSTLSPLAAGHLAYLAPNATVDALIRAAAPDLPHEIVQQLRLTELDDDRLAGLASYLLERLPLHADPPLRAGGQTVTAMSETRRVRDAALNELAHRGLPGALEIIAASIPDAALLRKFARAARERQADNDLTTLGPTLFMNLVSRGDYRLVRDASDVVDLVLEILGELQNDIRRLGAHRDIWDEFAPRFKPKTEDKISDWIAREVRRPFKDRLVFDRENQIATYKYRGGMGRRVDLTVTTATTNHTAPLARVLIEAKHVDNNSIKMSLRNQLHKLYMLPTGERYGIYLVYWIRPEQRPAGWTKTQFPTKEGLIEFLDEQAKSAAGSHIVPYVLDISQPLDYRGDHT